MEIALKTSITKLPSDPLLIPALVVRIRLSIYFFYPYYMEFKREGGSMKMLLSNALQKYKPFGNRIKRITSLLTPEASDTPSLGGVSKTMAQMSNEAYKSNRKNSLDGYTLDSLSTPDCAVYVNFPENKVIMAFRGTSQFKDIATDIQIAAGATDGRPDVRREIG